METENFTNTNNVYKIPRVEEQAIKDVLDIIQDKKESYKDMELHPAVIEAGVEQLLFLGRLKRLNDDMKHEDESIRNLLKKVISIVLGEEFQEGTKFSEYLININLDSEKSKALNKILDRYLGKSIGEKFAKSLEGQSSERLKLWNHKHYMTTMTRATGALFSEEGPLEVEHTNSIGTIFFDLDGLKAINDRSLGGYEAGDKALYTMARALCDKNLKKWAASQDIDLVPTHHHGDEFLLGIIGEKNVDLTKVKDEFIGVDGELVKGVSLIKYIGEYVNKTIEESPVEDILDFSNPEQLNKFKDFKDGLPEGLVLDRDFKYKLSCSYGYATLKDGIARSVKDKFNFNGKKPNGGEVDWEYIIFRLVGKGLIGTSEDKLKVSKVQGREYRVNSDDPRDRILEMLYRFGREFDAEKYQLLFKELEKIVKVELRRKKGRENVIAHNAGMIAQVIKELKEAQRKFSEQEHREALGMNRSIDDLNKAIKSLEGENKETAKNLRKAIDNIKNGE